MTTEPTVAPRVPRAPHTGADAPAATPVASDEERPSTGRTHDRASSRQWRDGMLLINLLPSQRRDGTMAVVDSRGRIRDYDSGELLAVTRRKSK